MRCVGRRLAGVHRRHNRHHRFLGDQQWLENWRDLDERTKGFGASAGESAAQNQSKAYLGLSRSSSLCAVSPERHRVLDNSAIVT